MKTKEGIYTKHLNNRVRVDSNKEIDHDHYLAIMDAMDEYANQLDKDSYKEANRVAKLALIKAFEGGINGADVEFIISTLNDANVYLVIKE